MGIIVWDKPSAFPGSVSEIPRRIKRILTRRPYASLKDLCRRHNLRYATCDKADPARLKACLKEWDADLVITSGCAIVPMEALADLPLGGINVHPSLLPQWKGANPLFWQLASHEKQVGVTVHELTEGVDRGDILGQTAIDRPNGLSHGELAQRLEGQLGLPLLGECINGIKAQLTHTESSVKSERTPQQPGTTHYARTVKLQDLEAQVPLNKSHPGIVWNLLRYLGNVPADWVGITGWHRNINWMATSHHFEESKLLDMSGDEKNYWQIQQSLFSIRLTHPQGWITLTPARLSKVTRLLGLATDQ